jgi:hypothetical protein
MAAQHHELVHALSAGYLDSSNIQTPRHLNISKHTRVRHRRLLYLQPMKYYKPLFCSAITVIYASFTLRVFRIGMASQSLKPENRADM